VQSNNLFFFLNPNSLVYVIICLVLRANKNPSRQFFNEQGIYVVAEGVAGFVAEPVAVEHQAPRHDVAQGFFACLVFWWKLTLHEFVDGMFVRSPQCLQDGFLSRDRSLCAFEIFSLDVVVTTLQGAIGRWLFDYLVCAATRIYQADD